MTPRCTSSSLFFFFNFQVAGACQISIRPWWQEMCLTSHVCNTVCITHIMKEFSTFFRSSKDVTFQRILYILSIIFCISSLVSILILLFPDYCMVVCSNSQFVYTTILTVITCKKTA